MKTKRSYFYSKKHDLCAIHIFREAVASECTICKSLAELFAHKDELPDFNLIKGLVQGNLDSHLKSGKHWKQVNTIIKEQGKVIREEG